MCYLVSHDKKQPACEYDEIGLGDRLVPKNATIETVLILLIYDLNYCNRIMI